MVTSLWHGSALFDTSLNDRCHRYREELPHQHNVGAQAQSYHWTQNYWVSQKEESELDIYKRGSILPESNLKTGFKSSDFFVFICGFLKKLLDHGSAVLTFIGYTGKPNIIKPANYIPSPIISHLQLYPISIFFGPIRIPMKKERFNFKSVLSIY